jgi:hypothetical protein
LCAAFLAVQGYSGICEDKNHAIIPLLGGCDRYILCMFGREAIVFCPPNSKFSLEEKDCVPGDPSNCLSPTVAPGVPSTWENVCNRQEVAGNTPIPTSCVYYAFCFNGFGNLRQCPNGQIFNQTKCVNGSQSTCVPDS